MKVSRLIVVIIGAVSLGFYLSHLTKKQAQKDITLLPNSQSSAEVIKEKKLDNTIKIVAGQTIYVPVYSAIYFDNNQRLINLANTLSIRNTDLQNSIIIKSVHYYSSTGQLVTSYLEKPIELSPLASKDFVVPRANTKGGTSANFIVEWVAQEQVSEPVIEAVMISTDSSQGISWVSQGRVIRTYSTK